MMRIRARNIRPEDCDVISLRREIAAAGIDVTGVHRGNRQVIIETPAPLDEHGMGVLRGVFEAHAPVWFEWTEGGAARREAVRCAEDVDRVTGRRIRALIGGADPVQEQMKILRLAIHALLKKTDSMAGKPVSPVEMSKADEALSRSLEQDMAIEDIRAAGKAFKATRGWV